MLKKPSKTQWKKWSLPSKITYKSYIIGIASFILTVIGLIYAFRTPPVNKTTNVFNINNKKEVKNDSLINKNKVINLSDNNKYVLLGTSNLKLKNIIEKSGKYKIVNKSNNSIEISHTGDINLLTEGTNSYIYTGGYLKIVVNQNCTHEIPELKIPSMRANPKNIIVNEIINQINHFIDKTPNLFANKIFECIKKQ